VRIECVYDEVRPSRKLYTEVTDLSTHKVAIGTRNVVSYALSTVLASPTGF
jgi:hypothetical protein